MSSTLAPWRTVVNRHGDKFALMVYRGYMTAAMPRPKRKEPAPDDEFVTLSIRMLGRVYNAVSALSDQQRRTMNAQIVLMIERQLEAEERPKP